MFKIKEKIGGEKETKSIKIWLAALTLLLLGGIVAGDTGIERNKLRGIK